MPTTELAEIANEAIPLHAMENRKHPRAFCIDRGIMRLCVRPEFRGRRALLVDVSVGGIGILLEESLEKGTVLVFEMKSAAGAEAFGRIARVRHSRPHPVPPDAPWLTPKPIFSRLVRQIFGGAAPDAESAWLIGCEFECPLTDDELSLLRKLLNLGPISTGPADSSP